MWKLCPKFCLHLLVTTCKTCILTGCLSRTFWDNYLTLQSWALLERPLDVRPLDSFPAFHGTRRFNTEFTRFLRLFLSWVRPIQSTSPHPTSPRSILILFTHLRLGLPSGLFPSGFPTNNLYALLFSPNSCYMPRPSHPPRLNYSDYNLQHEYSLLRSWLRCVLQRLCCMHVVQWNGALWNPQLQKETVIFFVKFSSGIPV
jgi:hypothetical protein